MSGDNCHFQQGKIPVAVITDLEGNIVLSNTTQGIPIPGVTIGNITVPQSATMGSNKSWVISGIRVMQTRFWTASTASIVLVCSVNEMDGFPPDLPSNINIERDLCIWMGYIDSLRLVNQTDLTNGNLLRVFIGVIDTVQATMSATGGYTIQVQCRDRMKWLMDSSACYNQGELEPDGSDPNKIYRSKLVLDIAQRAVAQGTALQGKESECPGSTGCGKTIVASPNYTVDISDKDHQLPDGDTWYKADQPLSGKTRTQNLKVSENPEFRIFSTRLPVETGQTQNFIMNNQIPIEMIKVLANQEVYPTEVFQDYRDGNIYYAPRANDISGLTDPLRFNRTYYAKVTPKGVDINVNQRCRAFREERSSIALKTNIIVELNSTTSDNTAHNNASLMLRSRPDSLKGVNFACKVHRIYGDPTIKHAAEAAVIALSAARILSKDTKAGMMVVMGDPSFTCGEVIQVLGSPLVPNGGLDKAEEDKANFLEYNGRWNKLIKSYAQFAANDKTPVPGDNQDKATNAPQLAKTRLGTYTGSGIPGAASEEPGNTSGRTTNITDPKFANLGIRTRYNGHTTTDLNTAYALLTGQTVNVRTSYYSLSDGSSTETASGETFNGRDYTAASKELPFNTVLNVYNPTTGKSIQVRVNDSGPYIVDKDGGPRSLDLSEAAAQAIGLDGVGTMQVTVVSQLPTPKVPLDSVGADPQITNPNATLPTTGTTSDTLPSTNVNTSSGDIDPSDPNSGFSETDSTVSLPVYDGTTATFKVTGANQSSTNNLLCDVSSSIIDKSVKDAQVGFNPDPLTIYRVDAIHHRFNLGGKGFESEILVISPF